MHGLTKQPPRRIFPEAPLVAFRRQTNIREKTVRAKVAPIRNPREKQFLNGMKKCGSCVDCSYVREGNKVKAETFTWTINKKVSCQDSNVIY